MTERVTNSVVVMKHPFTLTGVDRILSPGRYIVETTEEQIPSISFLAYRRVSTNIMLPALEDQAATFRQIVEVDPAELEPLEIIMPDRTAPPL